jgi:putative copper export protein
MDLEQSVTARRISSIVVTVLLAVIAAGMVYVVLAVTDAKEGADDPTLKGLARLAWIAMLLLAVAVVLLVWSLARTLRLYLARPQPHTPTTYVDAWSEAGRRIQVDEEDDEDEEADEGD